MKKSILIILLLMMAFGIKVLAGEKVCYVIAKGNTYIGQELKIGLVKTKVFTLDGQVVVIKNREIDAYCDGKRLYERMPVICEKNDTICSALMEFVTSRNGLRLYRYTCITEDIDPAKCTFRKMHEHYAYFVFQNGKMYLRINDPKTALTALPFFGVEIKYDSKE